jgi:DNA phosphorothioation-associated putative methyltransferase
MAKINRGATAIHRVDPSAPTKWAHKKGYISKSVFDWGCGQGVDVEWLTDLGHKVSFYDLVHYPENNPETVDFSNIGTIMCHYVLNVIDIKKERAALLKAIASKGVETVIVSVRSDVDANAKKRNWQPYKDGFLVPKNGGLTFQRNYTKDEVENMQKLFGSLVDMRNKSGGITGVFPQITLYILSCKAIVYMYSFTNI